MGLHTVLDDSLSSTSDEVFFVGFFFVAYLICFAYSVAQLRMGSLTRDEWVWVFTPALYYALIPLHGNIRNANVDLLWELTFQWTPPAAAVGFIIGSVIKNTKEKRRDESEGDESK
jgi:hypothetical protein